MSGYSLVEGLAVGEAAEVEGGAPAVLIEIRGKVVVMPSQSGIFCFPGL